MPALNPPPPSALPLTLAAALPSLLAYNLSPSPTIFNQCLAIGLWGFVVMALAPRFARDAWRDAAPLLAALALVGVGALLSWGPGALPSSIALSALALIAAASVTALAGAAAGRSPARVDIVTWFYLGLLLAGVLGACIALVQVFVPSWADGDLIARSGLVRRAVGNLRQPNHLSSQLVWALVALVALLHLGRLRRVSAMLLLPLLVGAVVLSGSRTGMADMGLLAAWGLLDRRLGRPARALLLAAPLLYAAGWLGMQAWAAAVDGAAGAAAAGGRGGDISSSRFGIWSNTLALIERHPWAGVGFGEFNLAWTLTPFPGRPVAFFDHTHNLPLQLAVELGLPLACLVLGLLGVALARATRCAMRADATQAPMTRPLLVMVLAILWHSLLEYPLWYAYFLLPAAFAWGMALAAPHGGDPKAHAPTRRAPWLAAAGAAMLAGAALAVVDYLRVVRIFVPPAHAAPLAERIASGQRSVLFAYHADYAALTTGEPQDRAAQALAMARAPHFLLDTRLMLAMASALAADGDLDRARHVADRLREFRNPAADTFFAACEAAAASQVPPPFQCAPAQAGHAWRELVAR